MKKNTEYIAVIEGNAIVAIHERRIATALSTALGPFEARDFLLKLWPTNSFCFPPDRCATGRNLIVYLSKSPDGIGRIGRNWIEVTMR